MADSKISALPASTTPLAGTEIVPIVQSGTTKQVSVQNILSSTQPTGTANGVTYLNGSKVLTSGTALTFDGTLFSNTVADNTIAVKFKAASSNIRFIPQDGGAAKIAALNGAESAWYPLVMQASNHQWVIDTTEAMRLTSTGLGIGTSSPLSKLTVQTQATARLSVRTSEAVFGTVGNGSAIDSLNASDSSLAPFGLRGNGVYVNDGTGTTTFINGNLGLGVTPSTWFSAYKAFQSTGYAFWGGANFANYDQNAYLNASGVDTYVAAQAASRYSQANGQHQWRTAPFGTAGNPITFTQAMTLDANGNLLVGQTSPAIQNSNSCSFNNQGNSYLTVSHVSGTATTTYYAAFGYAGTDIGSITQNGTTGVLYNINSDYRLKNITGPITTSGAYIDSLKPVEGTWKADGSTFVGLIAHETQEASRTTVATGTKDGAEMQGMDYSSAEIIANLIAELQDLRKRLAAAGI